MIELILLCGILIRRNSSIISFKLSHFYFFQIFPTSTRPYVVLTQSFLQKFKLFRANKLQQYAFIGILIGRDRSYKNF